VLKAGGPVAGPQAVVVRTRACGTGTFFVASDGMPVSPKRRLPMRGVRHVVMVDTVAENLERTLASTRPSAWVAVPRGGLTDG
jgi:hypothetical protein